MAISSAIMVSPFKALPNSQHCFTGEFHLLELQQPVPELGRPLEVPPLCRVVDLLSQLLHHLRQLLRVDALLLQLVEGHRVVILLVDGGEDVDDLLLDALGRDASGSRCTPSWTLRRRVVSSMVLFIDSVILSANMITRPLMFLAARPHVWMREVSERRKPSLSASRMATRETSGRSSPSLSRLTPTSTSNLPRRRSRTMAIRSSVSTSEWRYFALTPASRRKSVRSSANRLVRVVTRTRSLLGRHLLYLFEERIHLVLGRFHLDDGVHEARRAARSARPRGPLPWSARRWPGVAET